MNWLKQVQGQLTEILDSADQKTQEADLQALAGEVAEVSKNRVGARVGNFDLGLAEGWKELKGQISGDIKDAAAVAKETAVQAVAVAAAKQAGDCRREDENTQGLTSNVPSSDTGLAEVSAGAAQRFAAGTAQGLSTLKVGAVAATAVAVAAAKATSMEPVETRLTDLKERVQELQTREEERSQARERMQRRLEEAESELQRFQEEAGNDSEGPLSGRSSEAEGADEALRSAEISREVSARLDAMRREFCERQEAAEKRAAMLEVEAREVQSSTEPIRVELDFWKEKAQRMLEARGLADVPHNIRARAERADHGDGDSGSEGCPDPQDSLGGQADARGKERAVARANHERAAQAHAKLQAQYQEFTQRLAVVMLDSDNAIEAADAARRRERELAAAAAAAESDRASAMAAAELASRQVREASLAREATERHLVAELQNIREARASGGGGGGAASELRRRLEGLRSTSESLSRENKALESRLGTYRRAAAADLERAVPLASASFWQTFDGPAMKVTTLLVRSQCLRRFFGLHLLATYAWLFFLMFWLEKH